MSAERVKDKKGESITEGDYVWTRYRGGSHEGEVSYSITFIYICANLLISCTG